MISNHFFGEEPARDSWERIGQQIGNVIGIAIMIMMAWVVLRGFF